MNVLASNTQESICIFNDPAMGEQYSSFVPETLEAKVKLYNAINSPDGRLADLINTPFSIKDVVIRKVELSERKDDVKDKKRDVDDMPFTVDDQNPNGKREGFRVILIDTEGRSFTATSTGIYNSVCTLRGIFGDLHFENGLKAVVKQISTKNGNTLTLSLCE